MRGSGADCKTKNKLLNVSVTSSFPVNAHAFPTALPPRKRVEIEPSLLFEATVKRAKRLQNVLKSNFERFINNIYHLTSPFFCKNDQRALKPVLRQPAATWFVARQVWFVDGKTGNIAVQLVLQQCWKTSYTFLLPVLTLLSLSENWVCLPLLSDWRSKSPVPHLRSWSDRSQDFSTTVSTNRVGIALSVTKGYFLYKVQ